APPGAAFSVKPSTTRVRRRMKDITRVPDRRRDLFSILPAPQGRCWMRAPLMRGERDMSGPRFKPLSPDAMTPEQKRVVQALTDGPRGGLRGPFPALLRSPVLADRVRQLGDYVRFESGLPARLRELTILVVARFWSAQYEWYAHRQHAEKAGLDSGVADA